MSLTYSPEISKVLLIKNILFQCFQITPWGLWFLRILFTNLPFSQKPPRKERSSLYCVYTSNHNRYPTMQSLQRFSWNTGLWFLRIFPDIGIFVYKSSFASKFSETKRGSHQGKKEEACIVSKPLVSVLVGTWRVCKSSKIIHPGGSGGFVL